MQTIGVYDIDKLRVFLFTYLMIGHVPISIVDSFSGIESQTQQMLAGELPIFQISEIFSQRVGSLAIVESFEPIVRATVPLFVFNDYLMSGKYTPAHDIGPHYHKGLAGVTLQKNLAGSPVVRAAYRGTYVQSELDVAGQEPWLGKSIEDLVGIDPLVHEGATVPGRITVIGEGAYEPQPRRRSFRRRPPAVETRQPVVHHFIRDDPSEGRLAFLGYKPALRELADSPAEVFVESENAKAAFAAAE